jgi:hypothetical protein
VLLPHRVASFGPIRGEAPQRANVDVIVVEADQPEFGGVTMEPVWLSAPIALSTECVGAILCGSRAALFPTKPLLHHGPGRYYPSRSAWALDVPPS